MNDEIKEWKTQTAKLKIAGVLMSEGISFSYAEEYGIVFSAPESYVRNLAYRLKVCYGAKKVVIDEYKG